jgi:hypothetical protein
VGWDVRRIKETAVLLTSCQLMSEKPDAVAGRKVQHILLAVDQDMRHDEAAWQKNYSATHSLNWLKNEM